MAYVNSGIEMKSAHYDWKIIIVIALFLAAVTVLVALKLVYPEFEPGKLLSAASQVPVASAEPVKNARPAPAATSKIKPAPITVLQPVMEHPASPAKAKTPTVNPIHKAGVASKIVCAAEDREAQLCQ